MAAFQYLVKTSERWDNIAWRAYGDFSQIKTLVEANPEVPIRAVIDAGTLLNVPVISAEVQATAVAGLPPWG